MVLRTRSSCDRARESEKLAGGTGANHGATTQRHSPGCGPVRDIIQVRLEREPPSEMRPFVKFVIWLAAAFVGFFAWNTAPDFQPIAT